MKIRTQIHQVVALCFLCCLTACADDGTANNTSNPNMSQNNTSDMTGSDMTTKDMSSDTSMDLSDMKMDISNDMPQDMPQDLPSDMQDMVGDITTDMTEDISEDIPADMPPAQMVYKGTGDVFTNGPLIVEVTTATPTDVNAPVTIWSPKQAGRYAVIVFQHGFLLKTSFYSQMLTHIASHGFVIVAPQMYNADGLPFGKPTAAEEAVAARKVLTWTRQNLAATVSVDVELGALALAGHSRGGKVIWGMMNNGEQADALVGIDPVDGTGGPLGGEQRVVNGQFSYTTPSLIIGTGLGPMSPNLFQPACAPAMDNHEQFYGASSGRAYHVEVPNYGHLDMLDDQTPGCGLTCGACPGGQSKPPMRNTTAGAIVAFLRAQLQGDANALMLLSQGATAPAPFTLEQK